MAGRPKLRVIIDHTVVSELSVRGPLTLGRDPDNAVVLPDPAVSGRHGRIDREGGRWRYTDLGGRNGTQVAAGPHLHRLQSISLDELTQLKLGSTVVEFRPGSGVGGEARSSSVGEPSPAVAPSASSSDQAPADPARLVIVGDGAPAVHELAGRVVVGRDPRCDVVVPGASISGRHAELAAVDGRWAVRDLGSTNGTSVGLAPVGESWRPLLHGSHLILGDVDVLFVLAGRRSTSSGPLDTEAFLRWLRQRRRVSRDQAVQVSQACARDQASVEEVLVSSGVLHPGELSELRHNASRRLAGGGRPLIRRLAWPAALLAVAALAAWWILRPSS